MELNPREIFRRFGSKDTLAVNTSVGQIQEPIITPGRITPIAQNQRWDEMEKRKMGIKPILPANITPFPTDNLPPKGA